MLNMKLLVLMPLAVAWAASSRDEPSAWGYYNVTADYFKVGGFESGSQDVYIVYPPDAEDNPHLDPGLPLVVFLHGEGEHTVNDTAHKYDALLQHIASYGVVVVAPTGIPNVGSADQRHLIEALRTNPALYPFLARVDFGRIGLLGHSKGGLGTVQSAAAGIKGVVVAATAHGAGLTPEENAICAEVKVPTLFMCGENDHIMPCDKVMDCYSKTPDNVTGGLNVFAELLNASHLEVQTPLPGGRWDFYIVQFLTCFLNREDYYCGYIYDNEPDYNPHGICPTSLTGRCKNDRLMHSVGRPRSAEHLMGKVDITAFPKNVDAGSPTYSNSDYDGIKVTVSGQSSGGSMAVQHLFAFSANVQGAGIAAGSPYGCGAMPDGHGWLNGTCYYGHGDISKLNNYVHDRFKKGLIDDPANLKSTPTIVFGGKNDWEVYMGVNQDIFAQLTHFVDPDKLVNKMNSYASHVWPLDHSFEDMNCWCGRCGWGYVDNCSWSDCSTKCCSFNNCGYDFAGDLLTRSYGIMKPRAKAHSTLLYLQQNKYMPPKSSGHWKNAALEKFAVAYVPTNCQNRTNTCRIHVNYHGCILNKWWQRLMWVNNLDLNEYGEANDIIILYPQAKGDKSAGHGCWNWGFVKDDHLFDTKQAVQLATVMNMAAAFHKNEVKHAIELPNGVIPTSEESAPEDEVRDQTSKWTSKKARESIHFV